MKSWKTLTRTPVVRRGKFLTLEDHDVELPDGRVIRGWPWLEMPDYVNVMAETVRAASSSIVNSSAFVGAAMTVNVEHHTFTGAS